jgi:hypothetical protein
MTKNDITHIWNMMPWSMPTPCAPVPEQDKPRNHHCRWKPWQEELLMLGVEQGDSDKDLAEIFGRTTSAIVQRVARINHQKITSKQTILWEKIPQ